LVLAALAWVLPTAGVIAAESPLPTGAPGLTSEKELDSGLVALKPTDVQFYLKTKQATLDRYQHPTPKDRADIAEAKRLDQAQGIAQAKMVADMQAGNMQKAAADALRLTPEQQATSDRGHDLASYDGVSKILAKEAGMPGGQWLSLSNVVEYAARLDDTRYGSGGDDSGVGKSTPEQLAYAANRRRISAANVALVAPSVPEIKRLQNALTQLAVTRAQADASP
jgi:hypothetical protein